MHICSLFLGHQRHYNWCLPANTGYLRYENNKSYIRVEKWCFELRSTGCLKESKVITCFIPITSAFWHYKNVLQHDDCGLCMDSLVGSRSLCWEVCPFQCNNSYHINLAVRKKEKEAKERDNTFWHLKSNQNAGRFTLTAFKMHWRRGIHWCYAFCSAHLGYYLITLPR